jgi:hypothetical protein
MHARSVLAHWQSAIQQPARRLLDRPARIQGERTPRNIATTNMFRHASRWTDLGDVAVACRRRFVHKL